MGLFSEDNILGSSYTVGFFGHREVDSLLQIEEQLDGLIRKLLGSKKYVEFFVGRNGDFDQAASSTIKKIKRNYRDDNCCHTLVLPYATAEFRENEDSFYEYYDDITVYQKVYHLTNRETEGTLRWMKKIRMRKK